MSQQLSEQTGPPSGGHPVNIGHLVMGLALLGIVGVWALVQSDVVTGDDVRWLLPIPWVAAGLVGLVASAVTGTRRHAVRQTGWVGQDPTFSSDSRYAPGDPEVDPVDDHTSTEEIR